MPFQNKPLLTVLIPTYNRAWFVAHVLHRFLEQPASKSGEVEFLVSDNQSPDDTASVVQEIARDHQAVRYFCQEQHLPTGEENLLHALAQCRGEYVWPMSDDDEPEQGSLEKILNIIKENGADFHLSNIRIVSLSGETLQDRLVKNQNVPSDISVLELVKNFGFVTTVCCFSAVIFRKSLIEGLDWREFCAISPIYCHVPLYIAAFKNRKSIFIHEPLVRYRFEGTPVSAWGEVGRQRAQQFYFPWTIGLMRHFANLRRLKFIDADFYHSILENGVTGQFHLSRSVLQTLIDQVMRWVNTKNERERLTQKEFSEIMTEYAAGPQETLNWLYDVQKIVIFLNQLWPDTTNAVLRSSNRPVTPRTMLDALPPQVSTSLEQEWLEEVRQKLGALRAQMNPGISLEAKASFLGFDVLRIANRFVALPSDQAKRLAATGQVYWALLSRSPSLLSSGTLEGVRYLIFHRAFKRGMTSALEIPFLGHVLIPNGSGCLVGDADRTDFRFEASTAMAVAQLVEGASEGRTMGAFVSADMFRTSGQRGARQSQAEMGVMVGCKLENRFLWSTDPARHPWAGKGGHLVRVQHAPLEQHQAVAILEDAEVGEHFLYQNADISTKDGLTVSAFVRPEARRKCWIFCSSNAGISFGAVFDLDQGIVVDTGNDNTGGPLRTTIKPAANGWYQLTLSGLVGQEIQNVMVAVFALNDQNNALFTGEGRVALSIAAPQLAKGIDDVGYMATSEQVIEQGNAVAVLDLPVWKQGSGRSVMFDVSFSQTSFKQSVWLGILDAAGLECATAGVDGDGRLLLMDATGRKGKVVGTLPLEKRTSVLLCLGKDRVELGSTCGSFAAVLMTDASTATQLRFGPSAAQDGHPMQLFDASIWDDADTYVESAFIPAIGTEASKEFV